MPKIRSEVEVERAVLLARANEARATVAELRAEGLSGPGLRKARDWEAQAWSAYRRAARR